MVLKILTLSAFFCIFVFFNLVMSCVPNFFPLSVVTYCYLSFHLLHFLFLDHLDLALLFFIQTYLQRIYFLPKLNQEAQISLAVSTQEYTRFSNLIFELHLKININNTLTSAVIMIFLIFTVAEFNVLICIFIKY